MIWSFWGNTCTLRGKTLLILPFELQSKSKFLQTMQKFVSSWTHFPQWSRGNICRVLLPRLKSHKYYLLFQLSKWWWNKLIWRFCLNAEYLSNQHLCICIYLINTWHLKQLPSLLSQKQFVDSTWSRSCFILLCKRKDSKYKYMPGKI